MTSATAILSRDHAFQSAFAGAEEDRATTLSALENLQTRIKADTVLIASLEKQLIFDTRQPNIHGVPFPFPRLLEKAETSETAHAFVLLGKELYAMASTALLAPDPIAWLCPGFRIDDDFARQIKAYSNLEITFLNQTSDRTLLASTLEQPSRDALLTVLRDRAPGSKQIVDLNVGGEHFISYLFPVPTENGTVFSLLQR